MAGELWLDIIEGIIFELRMAVRKDIQRMVDKMQARKASKEASNVTKLYRTVKLCHDHDKEYCAFCEDTHEVVSTEYECSTLYFCSKCGFQLWQEDM